MQVRNTQCYSSVQVRNIAATQVNKYATLCCYSIVQVCNIAATQVRNTECFSIVQVRNTLLLLNIFHHVLHLFFCDLLIKCRVLVWRERGRGETRREDHYQVQCPDGRMDRADKQSNAATDNSSFGSADSESNSLPPFPRPPFLPS